jgi:hypothetical protein
VRWLWWMAPGITGQPHKTASPALGNLGLLCVLDLQILQPASFLGLHATVPGAPLVEGGLTQTALAADLLDRQARVGLLQEADDLLLRESTLSHVRHSPC